MEPETGPTDRRFHHLGQMTAVLELGTRAHGDISWVELFIRPGLPALSRPPRTAGEAPPVSAAPAGMTEKSRTLRGKPGAADQMPAGSGRISTAALEFRSLGQPPHLGQAPRRGTWAAHQLSAPGRANLRPRLTGPAQGAAARAPTGTHVRGEPPLPTDYPKGPGSCLGRAPVTTPTWEPDSGRE